MLQILKIGYLYYDRVLKLTIFKHSILLDTPEHFFLELVLTSHVFGPSLCDFAFRSYAIHFIHEIFDCSCHSQKIVVWFL
jgi:hypothetical protein